MQSSSRSRSFKPGLIGASPITDTLIQKSELRIESGGNLWDILNSTFFILQFGILNSALKMVPEVGIAPTSPRLQRGANLPQLLGVCDEFWLAESKLGERKLVVPAGNAPASSGYQPGAGGRVQTPFELQDGKVNREALG